MLSEGFMTATFDFKGFAKDLKKQAEQVMPEDIASEHKKEFLDRIYDFTYIAGEAFSNDDTIEDADTARALTQVISEWTFHKYVDLLRSDIPKMYHESILQKVAYVAFEMGKESEFSRLSQDQMLTLVEFQTRKAYEKACQKLLENGQISQESFDKAMNLSNVDEYSTDKLCHNVKIVKNKKSTLPFTLTALVVGLLAVGLNIFYKDAPSLVIVNTFMVMFLSMFVGIYVGAQIFGK